VSPAFSYSITSSASTSSDSGAVRPSALAVLRLIVGSNLVGCDIVAVEHRFEMYEG
jgi:hypothetical protein